MVHSANTFGALFSLGQEALAHGEADKACHYWQACAKTLPEDLGAYRQLINAFRSIGHLRNADEIIQLALNNHPNEPELIADQANILLDRGHADAAMRNFIKLAETSRNHGERTQALSFLGNALMCLEYSAGTPPTHKKILAQQWGALATDVMELLAKTAGLPAWRPTADPATPLRVGFISGDLCDHPVGFLLLPLLQNRDPKTWTPYIYDNGSRQDSTQKQLLACTACNPWRLIANLSDADAIRNILADQLDILIDLSGHTGRSRLGLLAHKLAGKQLSWLGFSGTTGLPTIDGVILDSTLASGCTGQFTERLISLDPSRFCFRPPFTPPLRPPPAQEKGHITFGSFNNTAKYNPELIRTWARILDEVPNSQLILKWRTLADPEFCSTLWNDFARRGIDRSRIQLRGFSTHRQMLDEYNDIDIALDTFPFNGGFTSLEALWMGLPLVTLQGDTPIGKQSASFLKTLGKDTWIAQTLQSYVQIAQSLAVSHQQLVTTRNQQRYQIMDSLLYDALSFTRKFESLLVQLCRK